MHPARSPYAPSPILYTSVANTTSRLNNGPPSIPNEHTTMRQVTMPGTVRTYRMASRISAMGRGLPTFTARTRGGTETTSKPPTIARNEIALIKKHQLTPNVARTIPPSAGPNARAALNCAEFNVTAFKRCSRGTNSVTNDCHAATVKPPANAPSVRITKKKAIFRTPSIHTIQSTNVIAAWIRPPMIRTFRRSKRSATDPAYGPVITIGA